LKFNS